MLEIFLSLSEARFGPVWGPAFYETVTNLAFIIAIVAPLMGCVAYLTLWERKLIGWMQIRIGPNRVTFFGIPWLGGWAQPVADGIKLLFKEIILPANASKSLFLLAPVVMLMPALAAWAVIPFAPEVVLADINAGLLYIMALSSMVVYGVIVAGHMVEYSGMTFALFFLAEYTNMMLISTLTVVMFFGGWQAPWDSALTDWVPPFIWLFLKIFVVVSLFLWFRATFPRYRYDQIMRLGWKIFIPLTIVWIVVVGIWMQTPWSLWQ